MTVKYQCRLTCYVVPLNTDVILTCVLCQEVSLCISKPRQLNKGCHRSAELQQRQAVPLFYPPLVTKDALFYTRSTINN